jgi:hypothetical protein
MKSVVFVELTDGMLKGGYVAFKRADLRDFFPCDAVGGSGRDTGEGRKLRLHMQGFERMVVTDLAGDKMILRDRSWLKPFCKLHGLKVGDRIRIAQIEDHEYQVSPA